VLVRFLNKGGNGEVWEVQNSKNERAAIKMLMNVKPISYARFRDGIYIVRANSDINGLLPILDSQLPDNLSGLPPWFVMPLAIPLYEKISKKNAKKIIEQFIRLAKTLKKLHDRKISHRDIKPGNLFLLNGKPSLGDFGLVEYPDKNDVTLKGESVGPKWAMAPEMRRNAEKADGIPADVYSFAKTLWIFLTKQVRGFDGQYSSDTSNALQIYQPTIYSTPLDNLLFECTDDNPEKRPRMEQLKKGWRIGLLLMKTITLGIDYNGKMFKKIFSHQ
jgi:serine/threonine protein kinase